MAELIEPEDGNDMSREQWILARSLSNTTILMDSMFGGDNYTIDQMQEVLLEASKQASQWQVENLWQLVEMWMALVSGKKSKMISVEELMERLKNK